MEAADGHELRKVPLHEQSSRKEPERVGSVTETTQTHLRNDRPGRDVDGVFDETNIPAGAIPVTATTCSGAVGKKQS